MSRSGGRYFINPVPHDPDGKWTFEAYQEWGGAESNAMAVMFDDPCFTEDMVPDSASAPEKVAIRMLGKICPNNCCPGVRPKAMVLAQEYKIYCPECEREQPFVETMRAAILIWNGLREWLGETQEMGGMRER